MLSLGVSPLLALLAQSLSPGDVEATATYRAAAPPTAPATTLPKVGVMVDAGLPDGANAALVFRPLRWLRAHAGGGYNLVSPGVRAGATLLPFGSGPSLTLEGGHYFDGNANGLARRFAGAGYTDSALLDRVGYDYANLHVGLDFGYRRVTFYLHAGVSYLRARVHNLNSLVQSETSGYSSATVDIAVKQDPIVRVIGPSAKLGLIVYLW